MYLYNGYYSTAEHFEDCFVLGYDSRQSQQKHLPDDTIDWLWTGEEVARGFFRPPFITRTDAMRSRARGEHRTSLHTLLQAAWPWSQFLIWMQYLGRKLHRVLAGFSLDWLVSDVVTTRIRRAGRNNTSAQNQARSLIISSTISFQWLLALGS